ncbi:MAG: YIP1 family protein [Anaerolineae bacterium]|nr:YIP1 family protein [Anaerolineae bacterium]MDW8171956.1 YIP1 family protein [Anaerolineae bacterium]
MAQSPATSSSRRRPAPSRSLWSSLWAVLFRPGQFFSGFPRSPRSAQQTTILALALLALSVWVALNPPGGSPSGVITSETETTTAPTDGSLINPSADGMIGQDVLPPVEDGFDPSIGPLGGEQLSPGMSSDEVTANWLKGLRAAFGVVLTWFLQALFLCEVPLLRGKRPDLSLNMRLAVWASLPSALLVGLQTLFVASGGRLGAPGLSGLVPDLSNYLDWPLLAREMLLALAAQFTIFWLWSMALLYHGARRSLEGTRWMALLVVALWIISSTLLPVSLRLLGVTL